MGVILGPTLLDFFHWDMFHGAHLDVTIKELAELGVIMLMFLVGLEVNINELAKVGKVGVFAGIAGALLPVAFAYPVIIMDHSWEPALFGGVVLAATSVSISAQVLLELGFLQTKEGNALLATALIDDVLAILLVSITIAVVGSGGSSGEESSAGDIVLIVVQMFVYLAAATAVAWFLLPRLMDLLEQIPGAVQSYGIPAAGMVIALIFAWSAEELGGVATITGSFIAGVGLSQAKEHIQHEIEEATAYISYAFLVPIFFIHVGLETDLSTCPLSSLGFMLLLLAGAVISKIGGCGLGAKLGGFNNGESFRLGVCMISRGEVGLIIASLGLSSGVFAVDDPLDASLFMVIILTTLVTPILVRMVFPRDHDVNKRSGTTKEIAEGATTS
jgi:Kef-type K+ transport system membrane component KefB